MKKVLSFPADTTGAFDDDNASSFHINPEEGTLILFPSAMEHCTASHSNDFKGERLAIVGDITLVYKEDGDNDYSMGFVNPKFWRTYK